MCARLLRVVIACTALLVASSANANLIFSAGLLSANENPAIGSPALGAATVTLEADNTTLDVLVTFAGLVAPATAAHIHCCALPPTNQAVRVPFSGFPNATSGTYSHTFDLDTDLVGISKTTFLTGLESGQAYVNIHDATFPGARFGAT